MGKREKQKRKRSLALLKKWMREVSTTVNPRSWVEQEAIKSGREILYEGGLGNPLRGVHPYAALVRDKVAKAPRGGFYGKEGGMPQLIEAAIWFSEQVDGVKLAEDQVLVNETGSCQLLGFLAEAMADKEAGFIDQNRDLQVLIASPAYGRHVSGLPIRDLRYHMADFWAGEKKGISFAEALDDAIKAHSAKLVVLSSAYNPTTRVMTEKETASALEITESHGAVLFMDDAYRHVYRNSRGPIPSVLKLKGALDARVCATISASKAHQSPGNGGLLLGNRDIIRMAAKVRNKKAEGGSISTQLGFAAMLYDLPYIQETRETYDEFLEYLVETWSQAGWELVVSEATIFLKAPVPQVLLEAGYNANEWARLLARHGIIVYPNSFFPGYKDECLRICASGTKANIDKAAEVIRQLTNCPPPIEGTWPGGR